MCIIAYSKSQTIPDPIIKNCFKNNPHGAGIMYKHPQTDKIILIKGLMTEKELLDEYHKIPKGVENAIHCRIATSGQIKAEVTHPFPVRKSIKKMKKLIDETNYGMMHNGIVQFCNPKKGMLSPFSDSMLFAAKYLYNTRDIIDKPEVQYLIEEATNSRFCLMRQNNPTILIGNWIEDKGIKYSNSTYKENTYKYLSSLYYGLSSYDKDYNWSYKDFDEYDETYGLDQEESYNIHSISILRKDHLEDHYDLLANEMDKIDTLLDKEKVEMYKTLDFLEQTFYEEDITELDVLYSEPLENIEIVVEGDIEKIIEVIKKCENKERIVIES